MRNKFNNYSLVTSLAAATLLGIGLTTNNVKAYVQSSVNVGQKNKSVEINKQKSTNLISTQQHTINAKLNENKLSIQKNSTDSLNNNRKIPQIINQK